jgi:signal transduction histidine kinase
VSRIVARRRGTITVSERAGGGSVFSVTLPAGPVASPRNGTAAR